MMKKVLALLVGLPLLFPASAAPDNVAAVHIGVLLPK